MNSKAIIERLREYSEDFAPYGLLEDAAEAIEKLESALREIDGLIPNPKLPLTHQIKGILSKALSSQPQKGE